MIKIGVQVPPNLKDHILGIVRMVRTVVVAGI